MKKYEFILWDIDDTLIDFKESEAKALSACFNAFEVSVSDEELRVYSEINRKYWGLLEQGKVEKKSMLERRFDDFIEYLDISHIKGSVINTMYQEALGDHVVMYPGAYELCQKYQGIKKQYALTNGTIVAQNKKLNNTGLKDLLDGVFISDEVGYQKPDKRFFEYCFDQIPGFQKEKAIMIGDSLSSDMKGANNTGIDCCWYNPRGEQLSDGLEITYEISDLRDVGRLVDCEISDY